MAIAFPTTGLTNGQEYTPPGIPVVKYTYNATKGVWVGAQAGSSYTLPTAGVGPVGTLGGVKVDGTSVTISSGVISATSGGPIAVLNFDTNSLNPPWTTSASLPALTVRTAIGVTVARVAGSVPGRYLVTFTTPRANANYVAIITLGWNASHSPPDLLRDNASYYILNQTATNFEIYVNDDQYSYAQPMDADNIGIAVFDATSGSSGAPSSNASVSATDVGNATAALTAGAVGTYLFGVGVPPLPAGAGGVFPDPGPATFGLVIPGANLIPSAGGGVQSFASVGTRFNPQGTWRCMGHAVGVLGDDGNGYRYVPTLWVRIT
jgi:hypothetical protein